MAMALHADHRAVEHVHRSEQARRIAHHPNETRARNYFDRSPSSGRACGRPRLCPPATFNKPAAEGRPQKAFGSYADPPVLAGAAGALGFARCKGFNFVVKLHHMLQKTSRGKTSPPKADKLPSTVSGPQLAALFAVSLKTLSLWQKAGTVVRVRYGRYDLARSVRAVVKRHKRSASETTVAAAVGSQRERLLRAQADRAEMQLKLEAGELLRTSEVRHETLRTFYVLRSGVMAVKARIGGQLPFGREGLALLDDSLREALGELADNRYGDDTLWTVRPAELAERLGLRVEAVDRFAKAGVLAPDSEGRVSLWGSVRTLVAIAARKKGLSNETEA
jgi:phage terminase Nu1 subunit (DNA packaging protein)